MKSKMSIVSVLLSIVFFISTGSFLFAQEQEEQGNVFAISTFKVPFAKLSEFQSHWEKEIKPRVKQNEFILSQRIFTHLYGPDWTVVVLKEYENFVALESSHKRDDEILKKKYPEQEKRDEITKQFDNLFTAHTDAIVREVPKLRK
jgi:hypothetical protein